MRLNTWSKLLLLITVLASAGWGTPPQVRPPVAGWAALALLHRLWPVGIGAGLGVVALVVWRMQARSRRDSVV